jgi:AbrB family looped-hinge helix DNA binding protein
LLLRPVRQRAALPGFVILSYGQSIDKRIVMRAKAAAKLSSRFQISIPKAVRIARRWQAGQEFALIPKGEGVLLVPMPRREDLAGLARGASPRDYRDRTDRA